MISENRRGCFHGNSFQDTPQYLPIRVRKMIISVKCPNLPHTENPLECYRIKNVI